MRHVARYRFGREFKKLYGKLPPRKQAAVNEALKRALADLDDPRLRLHALKGEFVGTYSLSAGGDLRIHLRLLEEMVDGETVLIASLQAVGTHSQLYDWESAGS